MATPDQVAVLDRCEGRGERYELVRLRPGCGVRVVTEDGARLDGVWTYWAGAPVRAPLLVDGSPVACRDVDQEAARELVGSPAPLEPGSVTVQDGAPNPAAWPDRVFVYGTLMPGRRAWALIASHVVGDPEPAWLPGRVHDTGRGLPRASAGRAGACPGDGAPAGRSGRVAAGARRVRGAGLPAGARARARSGRVGARLALDLAGRARRRARVRAVVAALETRA